MPPPIGRPPPLPSNTQAVGEALSRSEPLALLSLRMRESQARLAAVQSLLPPAMRSQVHAGPVDDAGWAMLVGNSAVAAKLRQLLPSLEAQLHQHGFGDKPIRVRLLPQR